MAEYVPNRSDYILAGIILVALLALLVMSLTS